MMILRMDILGEGVASQLKRNEKGKPVGRDDDGIALRWLSGRLRRDHIASEGENRLRIEHAG
jgi:hypothetical protein